jgi:acyl-coenzyme A synthetase/AMP-(fatty) acid ligase
MTRSRDYILAGLRGSPRGPVLTCPAYPYPKEFSYIIADASARAAIFTDNFNAGLEAVRAELSDLSIPVCVGRVPQWALAYEDFVATGDPAQADAVCDRADIAWLFYTSGTTGKPKGAMVTHANLQFMTDQYPREVYRLHADDVGVRAPIRPKKS